METLRIAADKAKLDEVIGFVDGILEGADCPMKVQMQIDVAVEEIFVNIASYAYENGSGDAEISMDYDEASHTATITFSDSGIPFDPLSTEDPDVTLSADERKIGGLGIYMVKKSMDEVIYKRENDRNILTIKKKC